MPCVGSFLLDEVFGLIITTFSVIANYITALRNSLKHQSKKLKLLTYRTLRSYLRYFTLP